MLRPVVEHKVAEVVEQGGAVGQMHALRQHAHVVVPRDLREPARGQRDPALRLDELDVQMQDGVTVAVVADHKEACGTLQLCAAAEVWWADSLFDFSHSRQTVRLPGTLAPAVVFRRRKAQPLRAARILVHDLRRRGDVGVGRAAGIRSINALARGSTEGSIILSQPSGWPGMRRAPGACGLAAQMPPFCAAAKSRPNSTQSRLAVAGATCRAHARRRASRDGAGPGHAARADGRVQGAHLGLVMRHAALAWLCPNAGVRTQSRIHSLHVPQLSFEMPCLLPQRRMDGVCAFRHRSQVFSLICLIVGAAATQNCAAGTLVRAELSCMPVTRPPDLQGRARAVLHCHCGDLVRGAVGAAGHVRRGV